MFDEKAILNAAVMSSKNQAIQMIMYKWRDRGCEYNSQMIDDVYKIIEIAREGSFDLEVIKRWADLYARGSVDSDLEKQLEQAREDLDAR
jgi:hypothetical protein